MAFIEGARRRVTDEDGLAMLTVLGISVIVLLFVTIALTLVTYQTVASGKEESRVKALHVADSGIDAYMYELRKNNTFMGSLNGAEADGSWVVTASPPTTAAPLTLRSVGTVPGRNQSRSVVATVRFPTFADYMFLTNTYINIGNGATIMGKVRANGNIQNGGNITGSATTAGTYTGNYGGSNGTLGVSPAIQHAPSVDFGTVVADLAAMKTAATSSSTYFGAIASGATGYRMTFSGSGITFTVEKVNATTSGLTVVSTVGTYNIPANGIVYFDDEVWVRGSYAAMCTVACSKDIYISENITASDPNQAYTLGLIADSDIILPIGYTTFPTNMTIQACMVARQGTIYADTNTYPNTTRTKVEIDGSMAYNTFSWFQSGSAGFSTRVYNYDERANLNPPPSFPVVHDGTLKVSTWVDQ
jgi:hypothetical protein